MLSLPPKLPVPYCCSLADIISTMAYSFGKENVNWEYEGKEQWFTFNKFINWTIRLAFLLTVCFGRRPLTSVGIVKYKILKWYHWKEPEAEQARCGTNSGPKIGQLLGDLFDIFVSFSDLFSLHLKPTQHNRRVVNWFKFSDHAKYQPWESWATSWARAMSTTP